MIFHCNKIQFMKPRLELCPPPQRTQHLIAHFFSNNHSHLVPILPLKQTQEIKSELLNGYKHYNYI